MSANRARRTVVVSYRDGLRTTSRANSIVDFPARRACLRNAPGLRIAFCIQLFLRLLIVSLQRFVQRTHDSVKHNFRDYPCYSSGQFGSALDFIQQFGRDNQLFQRVLDNSTRYPFLQSAHQFSHRVHHPVYYTATRGVVFPLLLYTPRVLIARFNNKYRLFQHDSIPAEQQLHRKMVIIVFHTRCGFYR